MRIRHLLAAVSLFAASAANATVIDFEGYTDPTVLTSFSDSGATFSGVGGTTDFAISAFGQPSWGTGAPMILCPRTGGIDCPGDFQVVFDSPVTGLSFLFTGDETTSALSVEAFLGATSLGILSFNPDGAGLTGDLADLSSLGLIDRIVVTGASADPAGFGYDDFTFTVARGVPEPSSWAMMVLGFGAIGFAARRGRKASAGYAI